MLIHITAKEPPAWDDTERYTLCGVRYAWRWLEPRGDWHHDALAITPRAYAGGERAWRLTPADHLCATCVTAM